MRFGRFGVRSGEQMKPPNSPLETLEFLPVRLAELCLFLGGEVPEAKYPKWVRKIGTELMGLLPERIISVAQQDPRTFIEGFGAGMFLSSSAVQQLQSETPEKIHRMERVMRGIDHSAAATASVGKMIDRAHVRNVSEELRGQVCAMLTQMSPARAVYFHGLALGLDWSAEIAKMNFDAVRPRMLLRAFLWLRWPEMVEAGSIAKVHKKCRAAFASTGAAEIVGSVGSFKKFCIRNGISFKRPESR